MQVHHLNRELLAERTKVKALGEELENPLNVHRWGGEGRSAPSKGQRLCLCPRARRSCSALAARTCRMAAAWPGPQPVKTANRTLMRVVLCI